MNRLICFILFGCSCLLKQMVGLPAAHAASDDRSSVQQTRPLTLADCVRLAERGEPVVLLQKAQKLGAAALVEQARTLPNPIVSYVAQDVGLQGANGPLLLHQATVGFSPFVALLRIQETRAAFAGQQQTIAAIEVERRKLRDAVGRAFYELLMQDKVWHVEQEFARLADQLVTESQVRRRLGDASGLSVLRAEAERDDAERQVADREHSIRIARLAFSLLLGVSSPQSLALQEESPEALVALPARIAEALQHVDAEDVATQIQVLQQQAESNRPELAQALAEKHQAELLSQLATLRAMPLSDVQVTLGIRSSQIGIGGVVTISGSLPILDWNQGARHRALAQGVRAQARLAEARQQVSIEIESSLRDFCHARTQRSQNLLPLVERRRLALRTTRRLFAEGLSSFSDVVLASRDLLTAQRTLHQVERDALIARWRLAVSLGAW